MFDANQIKIISFVGKKLDVVEVKKIEIIMYDMYNVNII
jgi:hypothetical protein